MTLTPGSSPWAASSTAAEVARLVVFLSNETGFTGSCVHLNGGLLMV